ncbi:precorrin-6Y C5,15-methyltransferase (decarboxylating), CbiT subunit [Synechococcus sp. PCC 7502]|uniref:precorrin-6Y C5,15-methyltransferase subunit CbiT n=1 Tax=Synechococcus sp. PCC 7502 TaxID=1173263 RepID=UPI00029FDE2E|nr:precorrin-6Y C5,15-methyltransferase subunit CbiT [Synechococcus sp. PCC 7502]AFY72622.1 precorrin-6Y C5,15-methyltransferase (decarboxylating), CbiT subunit [Synechococcus sp. PCC 7502]
MVLWNYATPGIPDEMFDRLPGIPLSKCEVRLLLISHLRLRSHSVFWDIGAGTGTIPVEVGLLCPSCKIVAIERDQEVTGLIDRNCQKFGIKNAEIINGSAPECLDVLTDIPDRILVEGGLTIKEILEYCWNRLATGGRIIATAATLEGLYKISESFSQLQVRNIEVVQSSFNRLETRGNRQIFAAVNPIFILSGDKIS